MTAAPNCHIRRPSSIHTKQEMDDQAADREERKREYNRLAQREFRRRRKEHLKNLEQAQREQTTEQSSEIERLRLQNAELKKENKALKAQIYGSSMNSQLMMPATLPQGHPQQRSYSLSPSVSTIDSMSTAGSPPTTVRSDMVPMGALSLTSSILHPSMQAYADTMRMSNVPSQTYSMVQTSGIHHNAQSSPDSSEFGSPQSRSAMGSFSQPVTLTSAPTPTSRMPPSQLSPDARENLMVVVPYDRVKARSETLSLFKPLVSDPAALSTPERHLSTLANLAASLPPALRPTKAQLSIPHYYGLDLIASPSLRDRLISVGADMAQQFVNDWCSCKGGSDEDAGQLIIWGDDPLNEMAWEFSREMLDRWGWLLGREWASRANFWRRQRGVGPLPEW